MFRWSRWQCSHVLPLRGHWRLVQGNAAERHGVPSHAYWLRGPWSAATFGCRRVAGRRVRTEYMNCPRRYAKVLRVRQLSPTEWAVLGLLSRGPQHGFALAKHLSCGGDFGHVWTVQRPLVYWALDTLRADGLVESLSAEPGDGGPPRRKMVITERGSALLLEWLRVPVKHIRDSRSRLLLKLAINDDLRTRLDSPHQVSNRGAEGNRAWARTAPGPSVGQERKRGAPLPSRIRTSLAKVPGPTGAGVTFHATPPVRSPLRAERLCHFKNSEDRPRGSTGK